MDDIVVTPEDGNADYTITGNTNLQTGNNVLRVTVIAEDDSTYRYDITVRVLSNDSSLTTLTVNGINLLNESSRKIYVDYGTTSIDLSNIQVILSDASNAIYLISGNTNLQTGNNTLNVTVTAEDSSTTVYPITVRVKSNNTNLTSLIVKGTELINMTPRKINVDYGTTTVDLSNIQVILSDASNAIVDISGNTNLQTGNNTLNVTVTAEDTRFTTVYPITVRVKSNNTSLTSLIVKSSELINMTPRKINLPYGTTFIDPNDIQVLLSDASNAIVDITGNTNLQTGNNTLNVTVSAEDRTITTVYPITVRVLSNNTALLGLNVNGSDLFNMSSRKINVPHGTTFIDLSNIQVILSDASNAIVDISGNTNLQTGNNTLNVTVSAEDRLYTTVYPITVRVLSNNTGLTNLTINGNNVFLVRHVNVPYGTNSVNVNPTLYDASGSFDISGNSNLIVGDNTVTVKVTAEDTTTQSYDVTVRVLSNNTSLSGLTVNGTNLLTMSPRKIDVPHGTTFIDLSNIQVILSDASNAIVDISGNTNLHTGNNTLNVTVTAEDRSYTTVYPITVRVLSNNTALTGLSVDGNDVLVSRELYVLHGTTSVTVSASPSDASANYLVSGNTNLVTGLNTVRVTVTAEDATTQSYEIRVIVRSNNTSLSTLTANGSDILSSKELYLPYGTNSVAISATLFSNATYEVSGNLVLHTGPNAVTLKVTAQDNRFTETYNINIVVRSNNTALSALVVDRNNVLTAPRLVIVPYGTTSIDLTNIEVILSDASNAIYVISGNTNLQTGNNTLNVTVTAEDRSITTVYPITVRVKSNNTDLSALTANGSDILSSKELYVPYGTSLVTINATPSDTNARYDVSGNTNLHTGNNRVTVTVSAEDRTITTVYDINIRVKSNNTALTALSVSGNDVLTAPRLVIVPYNTSSIDLSNIIVTSSDANASYIVSGNTQLNVGDNTLNVTVSAEDRSITTVYPITIRVKSNNTSLSVLTVNGTDVLTSRSLSVVHGTTFIDFANIQVTPSDTNAIYDVSGNTGLVTGNNTLKVRVRAEDRLISQEYDITITVLQSTNTNLSSLTINGTNVLALSRLNVSFGTTRIDLSNILVTPEDANAIYDVSGNTGLVTGNNILKVRVSAENRSITYDYNITVRVLSNNTDLSALTVNNTDVLTTRLINVPYGTTTVNVGVITTDNNDVYDISGNTGLVTGNNTVKVTVTAEDTTIKQIYNITVRVKSNNTDLSALTANGSDILISKELVVPYGTSLVTINATPSDTNARYDVSGNTGLVTGNNTVKVTVSAEDRSITAVYDINVRVKSNISSLSALSVNGNNVLTSPRLVNVAYGTTTINLSDILATLSDASASYGVTGNTGLVTGNNTLNVTVTAEDTQYTTEYPITIRVKSNISSLSALSVNGNNVLTAPRLVNVPFGTTSISLSNILATPSDASANYAVTGNTGLVTGNNTLNVTVTAEDTQYTTVYPITIRVKSNNTSLSALVVDGNNVLTAPRLVNVPFGTTSITLSNILATPVDTNAIYDVSGNTGLVTGDNTLNVTVSAEDRTITNVYPITVRVKSNNTSLSGLTVNGTNLLNASPRKIYVPYGTRTVDLSNILVTPSDTNAIYDINGNTNLETGNNNLIVTVSAEDRTITTQYSIIVRVRSNNTDLTALSVSGTNVLTSRSLSVPYGTTTIYYEDIQVTLSDVNARYDVSNNTGFVTGNNTLKIIVSAEDRTIKTTYDITVTVLRSTNANLSGLTINGTNVLSSLTFTVPNRTVSIDLSNIQVTTSHVDATYNITGNTGLQTGSNNLLVRVTAPNGTTTKDYTVVIIVLASTNDDLSILTVNDTDVLTSRAISIRHGTSSVTVVATPSDDRSTRVISGNTGLRTGSNSLNVVVTAENGDTQTYTVIITVLPGLTLTFSPALSSTSFTSNGCTFTSTDRIHFATDNIPTTLYFYDIADRSKLINVENIPIGVTSILDNGFNGCSTLPSFTVPNTVTSIGNSAFTTCSALTSVTIPSSVTNIGYATFSTCSNLTSVSIYGSISNLGTYMFYQCTRLKSFTIPPSVTNIGTYAFASTGLTALTIPNGVTNIDGLVFLSNTTLKSLVLPSSMRRINDNTFNAMNGLTSITIPDTITYVGDSAFYQCNSLKSVIIPTGVTYVGTSAFFQCGSLTSVTLPDTITDIKEDSFKECTTLTAITIPNSVSSISGSAFAASGIRSFQISQNNQYFTNINNDGCIYSKDTTTLLVYPPYNMAVTIASYVYPTSVKSIGPYVFAFSNITSITIPNTITSIGISAMAFCQQLKSATLGNIKSMSNDLLRYCRALTSVTIPTSVTSIGNGVFISCIALTSITIPNSVERIGSYLSGDSGIKSIILPNSVTSIAIDVFRSSTSLTSVTLSENIKNIPDQAFYSCGLLKIITIPIGVTNIGNSAFSNCSALTSVTMPNTVTSIREYAFYQCTGLKSVAIPNSVTSIGNDSFIYCSGLTSLTLSNSMNAIPSSAFNSCSKLTSVIIPDSVTTIAAGGFANCSEITSVTISRNVTFIGNDAFASCRKLRTVNLPNGLTTISGAAFYQNNALTSIIIPESVTSIGANAFIGTSAITTLTIPRTVGDISNSGFQNIPNNAIIFTTPLNNTNQVYTYFYGSRGNNLRYSIPPVLTFNTPQSSNIIDTYGTVYSSVDNINYKIDSGPAYIRLFDMPNKTQLLSVQNIPTNVTQLIYDAFGGCTALTSVTIPNHVTKIDYAFSGCTSLTYVNIPSGITSFEDTLFQNCSSLPSITIPNSVTSFGSSIFKNCSSLSSITIPNSVTRFGNNIFQNCTSLSTITIPNTVTNIGTFTFNGCTSLTNVTLPPQITNLIASSFTNTKISAFAIDASNQLYTNLNNDGCVYSKDRTTLIIYPPNNMATTISSYTFPNSVTTIGDYVFQNSNITSITIPSSITKISNYVFQNSSITSVVISNGVTSIGNLAFSQSSLKSVLIPGSVTSFNGPMVGQSTNGVFYGCTSLTSVVINEGVTELGSQMFLFCNALTSVIMPQSLVTIGYQCFRGTSLSSVTIPNSVTNIPGECFFESVGKLTSVSIGNSVQSISGNAFRDQTQLTSIIIPYSVTAIGGNAFFNCSALRTIYIPRTVASIAENNFNNISNLATIYTGRLNLDNPAYAYFYDIYGNTISYEKYPAGFRFVSSETLTPLTFVISDITFISQRGIIYDTDDTPTTLDFSSFLYKDKITSIENIPNSVTSISDYAFKDFTALTSITIPNSITSIGMNAFENCTALTSIIFTESTVMGTRSLRSFVTTLDSLFDNNGVNSIGNSAFINCSSLISVVIPNSVTIIGSSAFENCIALESVTLSDNIVNIDDNTFKSCESLLSIMIPENVTNIGVSAFRLCSSLTAIIIPGTVNSIGDSAFKQCSSATLITISNGVTSIGDDVFYQCIGLKSISIPGSITSLGSKIFYQCSSLTNAIMERGLTAIGEQMFLFCSSLVYVNISRTVSSLGYQCFRGTSLSSIDIPNNVIEIPNECFYDSIGKLKTVIIGNNVTRIGNNAFNGQTALDTINIPKSVMTIEDGAFANCSSLRFIYITKWVKTISPTAFGTLAPSVTLYTSPLDFSNGVYFYFYTKYGDSINYIDYIVCFKEDTKILTDYGYVPIQLLRKGDLVKTSKNGYVPINIIASRYMYNPICEDRIKDKLYVCTNEEYPTVFEDLVMTGCHSILVDDFREGEREKTQEVLGKIYVTDNKYRLPACVDERAKPYEEEGVFTIYHIALDNDDYYMNYGIYANGLLVESTSKRFLTELANMKLLE